MMNFEELKKFLVGRGELFEELVALILKKEYPQYRFEHTAYQCDGGKDFYSVDGDINIWAEAKSHSRHLELGRIAGTFIMADICQISQIIIFSLSPLTKGAIVNLTKYCSKHGKTLIVYNDVDIFNIVKKHKKFQEKEILDNLSNQFNGQSSCIKKFYSEINNQNFGSYIVVYEKNAQYKKQVYTICAYILFNLVVQTKNVCNDEKGVVIVDKKHFIKNREEPTKQIHAFDFFSSEIVLRNESMNKAQKVNVTFYDNTLRYGLLSSGEFTTILQPGQCAAAIFYFKAYNTSQTFNFPEPIITVDKKTLVPSDGITDVSIVNSIPCLIIGETPYLGYSDELLNKCCYALNSKKRKFETVVVYGKSGVGKTRFMHELHTAMIKKGKNCFVFHGDSLCNSTRDFFRQLLLSYYDLTFDNSSGKIELPIYSENIVHGNSMLESLHFIETVLNDPNKEINLTVARNWLVTLIKKGDVSLLIDNVQVLNHEAISLLYQVISDLQSCTCNSEIVLSFNTELMYDTVADVFFRNVKNRVMPPYRIEITDFDDNAAALYLKECLDPKSFRNDLAYLYDIFVKRVGKNPFSLKQMVLYLYQKNIIGFMDDTLCILDCSALFDALNELPATVHETVTLRYALLKKSLKEYSVQLSDLMWSVLIFGELPEKFVNLIPNFNSDILKKCVELGFLKYNASGALIFDHQLLAKSILLILENKPYNDNPVITDIKIEQSTAQIICEELDADAYPTVTFVLNNFLAELQAEQFERILSSLSYEKTSALLIPYVTELVHTYIRKYNSDICVNTKIQALTRLIHKSQDVLGTQRTQSQFEQIIEFQMRNYKLNVSSKRDFIELLKFYMYELPTSLKDEFLNRMSDIGDDFFSKDSESARNDFRIWIIYAIGKNRMHYAHDFNNAEEILKNGINLAIESNNPHRRAELEVQYGDLCAYRGNKLATIEHWQFAANNFTAEGIYDTVLRLVYEGNAMILKNDFSKIAGIMTDLSELYENNRCYPYLKFVIDDFRLNSMILNAVKNNELDKSMHIIIKANFNRFRSLALSYDKNRYLFADYKTLVYTKYILKNFSDGNGSELSGDRTLAYLLCAELISNYKWDTSNFNYFYPVFKDIAETVGDNAEAYSTIISYIPQQRTELFKMLATNADIDSTFAPPLKRGIFSDTENKICLFHNSYTW